MMRDLLPLFSWVFGVCLLASAVSIYRRWKDNKWSSWGVVGEMATCGFSGLMVFLLCVGTGFLVIPPQDLARAAMTAFLVGMGAHFSTRWLKALQMAAESKLKSMGIEINDDTKRKDDA